MMWSGEACHVRKEILGESTGDGTAITAANGSKGSYSTLGTTGFAWHGFWLHAVANNSQAYRFDVAIGGSNIVILPDLILDARSTGANLLSLSVHFPIAIPPATEVKARAQSVSTHVLRMIAVGYQGDGRIPRSASRLISLNGWSGTDPVNTVTQTGTAGSNTAWTELTSSLAADIAGLYLAGSTVGDTARTGGRLIVDIATGAGGSENVRDWLLAPNAANGGVGALNGPYPLRIPAGQRVSWRERGGTTMADSHGIAAWGLVG
jgi:hypothetical protein